MADYTIQQKINAANKACDVLSETKRKLEKAFGVTPEPEIMPGTFEDMIKDAVDGFTKGSL